MYAIVRAGGHQEKVSVGDEIEVNRVPEEPGATVELPAVMVVSDGAVKTGTDAAGVKVAAEVVDHHRGPKIKVLRYKNKTGYRRRQGQRQDLTRLRVTSIG